MVMAKLSSEQMIALLHHGFPDIKFILEDLIVENDKIVLHLRCTGKHTGVFISVQPTNKSIDTRLISILRIENGKVKSKRQPKIDPQRQPNFDPPVVRIKILLAISSLLIVQHVLRNGMSRRERSDRRLIPFRASIN